MDLPLVWDWIHYRKCLAKPRPKPKAYLISSDIPQSYGPPLIRKGEYHRMPHLCHGTNAGKIK